MMKKIKTIFNQKNAGLAILNAFALMTAVLSVNSACMWFHHQPEMPAELKKYRKF